MHSLCHRWFPVAACVRSIPRPRLIETYDAFDEDNDPHGERDFGTIYQLGDGRWTTQRPRVRDDERERVFWKLDYYDRDLRFASEDAADPAQTRRVLTIMLSDEY